MTMPKIDDSWIETYTGKKVNVFDVDPDTICIEDIAHSLALCNRFNGHTAKPLSVAEHSLFVANALPYELKLQGLMHDAAEAYISDAPRPIKQRMPIFNEIDENLTKAIFEKFNIPYPLDEEVVMMDRMMCHAEARASGMDVDSWVDQPTTLDHEPLWLPWEEVEEMFTNAFYNLGGR